MLKLSSMPANIVFDDKNIIQSLGFDTSVPFVLLEDGTEYKEIRISTDNSINIKKEVNKFICEKIND
jgi:hypothetical protein